MPEAAARPTIRGLMVATAAIAGLIASLDAYPLPRFVAICCAVMAGSPLALVWNHPRVAKWGFLILASWACVSVAASYAFLPYVRGHLSTFLVTIPAIPVAAGFGVAWARSWRGWRARIAAGLVVIVAAAFPASMVATFWPLKLAVALSAPALGRLADRVEAGGRIAAPEWAGLYRIVAANRAPGGGDVALVCDPDPGGISALVRRAPSAPPSTHPGALMDLGIMDGAGRNWSYLDED